jgi:hypothetical protein
VAVIELRGDPRLVDEHLDERLVGREVREDLLDRDQLLEAVIAAECGLEQLRHPTDRQPVQDGVPADRLRRGRAHCAASLAGFSPTRWPPWRSITRRAPDLAVLPMHARVARALMHGRAWSTCCDRRFTRSWLASFVGPGSSRW